MKTMGVNLGYAGVVNFGTWDKEKDCAQEWNRLLSEQMRFQRSISNLTAAKIDMRKKLEESRIFKFR